MRRREFITLLCGAAAAWPPAARAQQSERVRRIGVLQSQAADDAERQAYLAAFRQELERLGWTDGRNIQINYRWSAGNAADTRKYATELVALTPDLIFTIGSASMPRLLQATRSVPIVFRWGQALSIAWHDRVATPPALSQSNTPSVANGWSSSKKLRRA